MDEGFRVVAVDVGEPVGGVVEVAGRPVAEVVDGCEPAGRVVTVTPPEDGVGVAVQPGLVALQAAHGIVVKPADHPALLAGGLLPEFVELVPGERLPVEQDGVYPALRVVPVVDPAPVRG